MLSGIIFNFALNNIDIKALYDASKPVLGLLNSRDLLVDSE